MKEIINIKKSNKKTISGITLIALVITIIVLLILAGVSIATLTGQNGILTRANTAKVKTQEAEAREKIQMAVASSFDNSGKFDIEKFQIELEKENGRIVSEDETSIVVEMEDYQATINKDTGKTTEFGKSTPVEVEAPEEWVITSKTDNEWYSYDGNAKINAPKLLGRMTPIKYTGEIEENQNKWANAITTDGSMFVWIPRFAYRITEGYHTNTAGKIEVAFIDKNNNFLNGDSNGLEITDDPSNVTYNEENVQEQWLVHPAFTSNANIGGGFGEAGKGIEGFWIGKFEATGEYNSETETGILSVKPGTSSLVNMSTKQQFKLAKSSQFGESVTSNYLGSHMAKNSEWGAIAYLAYSKYGAKNEAGECGQHIARNTNDSYITGGDNNNATIYTDNKKQSTTYNATGVYDMIGGTYERTASYVYNSTKDNLTSFGGNKTGDLCDIATRGENTAYKTVYSLASSNEQSDYEANKRVKGDAIYETSSAGNSNSASWFGAYANFPNSDYPFFIRGGGYNSSNAETFYFSVTNGGGNNGSSFRVCLARSTSTVKVVTLLLALH